MADSIYYSQIDDHSEDIDYEGSIEEETRTMKIDHSRIRKSASEPPAECKLLIDRLKRCSRIQLLEQLSKISTWTFGKCELGHWKEVLAIFDTVLEEATDSDPENKWALNCDVKYSISDKKLLLWILHFTTLLIEHSFSRHTYRSMDKLLALLASSDMSVVLGVLNLLYMFSKRSNFITRMQCDQRLQLISRLHHLAESWGGKENGFGLAHCCNFDKPMPPSGTTLHFEFHTEQTESKDTKTKQNMTYIHVEHVDQIGKTPAEIMKGLLSIYSIPADKEMLLFTHVRLAYHFSNYRNRLLCVQARLQALSVLVYANALQDSAHTLLYNGLLEELVELIELKLPYLVEIRSAALRTLTSIIHLDRNPHFPKKPGSRLNNIIDVTGASQYHGFLPVLVRYCIICLTSQTDKEDIIDVEKIESDEETSDPFKYMEYVPDIGTNSQNSSTPTPPPDLKLLFPLPLATALFSFLYHLASYESGGDALVSCGMMESLLQVINWHGVELEHITFVTRAVRVIDLITNIDMQAFYTHGGLQSFINRLDVEVNLCIKEHSYDFKHIIVETDGERPTSSEAPQEEESINFEFQSNPENFGKTCLPQRAALLKSMLNFLKKALQDSTFSEHIRHLMEGTLPTSLKHIISNAEYYGPSLFLLATDVVTVYVFQEPSLLSAIQSNGLTDVVLQALLVKDVPATREVLASLPNVFSALCLNARGLASFVKCKPFERLFKVLLSPTYLSAMRKRRSSDPMGDAASNLGNAMDELMRHQPSLKVDATAAIIKLLNELCQLGTDPKYICWRPHSKSEVSPSNNQRSTSNTEGILEEGRNISDTSSVVESSTINGSLIQHAHYCNSFGDSNHGNRDIDNIIRSHNPNVPCNNDEPYSNINEHIHPFTLGSNNSANSLDDILSQDNILSAIFSNTQANATPTGTVNSQNLPDTLSTRQSEQPYFEFLDNVVYRGVRIQGLVSANVINQICNYTRACDRARAVRYTIHLSNRNQNEPGNDDDETQVSDTNMCDNNETVSSGNDTILSSVNNDYIFSDNDDTLASESNGNLLSDITFECSETPNVSAKSENRASECNIHEGNEMQVLDFNLSANEESLTFEFIGDTTLSSVNNASLFSENNETSSDNDNTLASNNAYLFSDDDTLASESNGNLLSDIIFECSETPNVSAKNESRASECNIQEGNEMQVLDLSANEESLTIEYTLRENNENQVSESNMTAYDEYHILNSVRRLSESSLYEENVPASYVIMSNEETEFIEIACNDTEYLTVTHDTFPDIISQLSRCNISEEMTCVSDSNTSIEDENQASVYILSEANCGPNTEFTEDVESESLDSNLTQSIEDNQYETLEHINNSRHRLEVDDNDLFVTQIDIYDEDGLLSQTTISEATLPAGTVDVTDPTCQNPLCLCHSLCSDYPHSLLQLYAMAYNEHTYQIDIVCARSPDGTCITLPGREIMASQDSRMSDNSCVRANHLCNFLTLLYPPYSGHALPVAICSCGTRTVLYYLPRSSSDDEEEDDEEEASTSSQNAQTETQESQAHPSEKTPIALTEYILNVTKFIDAILSNNSTDDHCREFVNQGGLVPLLKILGLPNLPVDCPVTNSAQAVASVCKSILNLAHEPKVLEQGLKQLNGVLARLKPLYSHLDIPGGSKLLHELASAPHLETAFSTESATPLLHAMGAAHGYVLMFVHVCRTGQNEIRTLSLQHWGSDNGIAVLKGLAELYTSLVWESTLLLALCSDDVIPSDCDFGREDMEKLNVPIPEKGEINVDTTGNVASAMEALTTNPQSTMEVDSESTSGNKPTSQQLKYIKPLLGASSRLGRALAELFGLLVKLCVGSPIRQRRGQNIVATPSFPSPYAQAVATALNSLLANGLNSDKLPPSPVPKFRLTFLICSVGFTSPMLLDEKRYPYHLMLQKFVNLGGQTTFFNTFRWALSAGGTIPLEQGLEHPNLPEGTGEFLDAWLTLLEKMVNPKAILDSPHVITTKSQTAFKSLAFDPLKYLIQIHKLAFKAVMLLWGKKPLPAYGIRMSESILSILRHILRGEKIIKDRMNKTEEKTAETAASSASTSGTPAVLSNSRTESDVNAESLRQLMDMGFSREHAMEALMHSLSVEQATDYLLSNPPALIRATQMDIDMSEDDQVIQAIAMSLGEPGPSSECKKKEEPPEEIVPLSEELIDEFTHDALKICLNLIEVIPESVFKVCDLLVTIMKRNGREFRDQLLDNFCKLLLNIYESYELAVDIVTDINEQDLFGEAENTQRLAYYTHLFTLFFEVPPYFDMRGPCGLAIYKAGLIPHFIKLISIAERTLVQHKKTPIPKWLTPILLLLDSLGKVSVSTQRKRLMHLVTKRVWKWYDIVSGKWTPYSPTNNKIINEAYWNGEQTSRITCGRRRYTISFTNMQQINEESSNNRPICMTPINMSFDKNNESKFENYEAMETEEVMLTEKEEKRCIPIPGFSREQSEEIVRSCVKLMNTEIDKDTLHAIMRLCLRLTQDFENAKIFVKEGGIVCLIQLKESMAFNGFRTLATLLIRHTFEGPSTLAYAMEKVMRGRALPSTPPPYKELMFMLRSLSSAVARDPDTFLEVAKATLRVDVSSYRRNDEVDTRLPMKTEPSNRTQAPLMKEQESMDVVIELLNSLIQPIEVSQPEEENFEAPKQQPSAPSTSRESMCQRASYLLSTTTGSNDILNVDGQDDARPKIARSTSDSNIENKANQEIAQRPILAKHSVLKILADAVVSYAGVARLITDHTYRGRSNDIVTDDCTCLAFLFDKILPMTEGVSDRDCSMMCRNLISGIASCNHSPEAQSTLVTEVKAALVRALLMPESAEKHTRLQHITGIILNMIEQCPPVQQVRIFKSQTFNANVNNIARLMLRKGIFGDLARVPHCLDMSSPNFPITINSALKPMECLSKIVNQPVTGNITGNITKKRQRHGLDDNGTTHSGTTSTEATNAQGEEAVEDAENTEHDLSAVASSLEGNPITSGVHEDNVLEEIMEQLLERGPNGSNATMEIDDDANLGYDHERDATEELMSTDSGESDDEVDEDENEEETEVDDGDGEENEDENEDDDEEEEDIDEGDDDDDNNYDDFENAPSMDRDEDIVMIQYPDDTENDSLPVVRWNDNGFSIPLFEDSAGSNDQSAPATHPLLISRHNNENNSGTVTRTQRTNRTRRYQYLQLNTRNANPPVILQSSFRRLLGPTAQSLHLGSNQMLNSQGLRDSARVVVMDNFGFFPSVEEQIDFVDQSGYLFGPSMMATINHIPVALHWWKEESRFIDGESMHDIVTYICNKLVPILMKYRNDELLERKRKADLEDNKQNKNKPKSNEEGSKAEDNPESGIATNSAANPENMESTTACESHHAGEESEEDIDGVPLDDSPYNTPTNVHGAPGTRSENEQQPIRVVNLLDGDRPHPDYSFEVEHLGSPFDFNALADLESRTTSDNYIFPNMQSPQMELIHDGPEESQNEAPEDHDDDHDDDQDEETDDNRPDPATSLFSTVYPGGPYPLLSTTSLLRPLFQYTSNNVGDGQGPQSEAPTGEQMSLNAHDNDSAPQQGNTAATCEGSSRQDEAAAASSDNARNADLSDDVPEGVDPSFLDALPPEMRREVLEQHRLLRLQQRISMSSSSDQAVAGGSSEVSPEFLAALPPSLQEEVLTQQRLEQQRQAAARANPDEPVDAGAFFETLQPSLRTMILSDMEDSQMSVLPPDLAAEAQTLRRDWEARNRQMVQERFFQSNFTTIIRHSARGRLGSRFNTQLLPHSRQQWNWSQRDIIPPSSSSGNIRIRGRQLLDHESLSCLLVLLFVDDPKLNTGRLHRVIRNLCYHLPTRDWVVKALLSIIDRSVHVKPDEMLNKPKKLPRPGPLTSKLLTDSKNMGNGANWLNIRMEAALGCHANVFIVNRVSGKRTNVITITIHPQAAPIICRNALDLFTSLSRSFPTFLLPLKPKDKSKSPCPSKFKNESTDFWDMLLKLDAASTKKGKSLAKTHSNLNLNAETENTSLSFEQSAFGQLLVMLSSPVIRGSIHLTDKLLRLLSVISMGMPELTKASESSRTNKNTSQNFESVSAPEVALNLAVNVLTYKSCSEEGLEEVTTLLLNLSNCSIDMSFMILNLLLKGALRIGEIVRSQIQDMLEELKDIHKVETRKDDQNPSTSKGILSNRFTKETVVITASSKVKASCDLQLPSMVPLTSKSSSQIFFLRVLRVIVQIRDAIKKTLEKDERTDHSQLSPLSDQLDDLENLWNTLSQCLLELEHTPDHHAVLVLQPAVEAFFLVHSPHQEANPDANKSNDSVQETAEPAVASVPPPTEVAPAATGSPAVATPPVAAGASPVAATTSASTSLNQSSDLSLSAADTSGRISVPLDQMKFLNFAEKHRTVLNQILRQTTAHLADGPFSVLVDHTRVLDFDIKRRYFRTELERLDQNLRREETAVHVRREHVFEDSFRELYRRTPEEWKNRFYIVFEDEEGQDAGGLLREWYVIISRDIFNPMYALFTVSPGDRVTYMINPASHYNPNHLCYYKFVGRVIAKAIYDNKLLECYFTRSFYKHILGISVKYTDMESEDYSFYRGLVYLMENNINDLGCDLTFSTEINEFGVTETRDLITNGRNVPVTEENKMEYVRRSCQMKMTGAIRQQLTAFLEGFYDIIPKRLISIFNEQELELLISGLPNVDIEDLKANTEYHKYQATSLQIQWFWRALRAFDQADRAKFLQFVTGTSKVPLQGFGALEGMNGVQKFQIHRDDRSTDRLPSAHTCFNQLDLPVYETYDKLRSYLLKAIHECSEGFGFA